MFSNDGGENGHRQDEDVKDGKTSVKREGPRVVVWRPRWSLVVGLTVVALVGVSWVALHTTETREMDEGRNLTAPLAAEDQPPPRQRKQARKGCPSGV